MSLDTGGSRFSLRRVNGSAAGLYREIRLEGLRSHPEAFGASWEAEASQPLAWFADRIERTVIFGAGLPDGSALAGVVGFLVPDTPKLRHKGVLWGIFVRPEARASGLGAALVTSVLEHAAQIVEEVRLTVAASNTGAIRLYARAGFEQYGLERRALKVGDNYYDELLMAAPVIVDRRRQEPPISAGVPR